MGADVTVAVQAALPINSSSAVGVDSASGAVLVSPDRGKEGGVGGLRDGGAGGIRDGGVGGMRDAGGIRGGNVGGSGSGGAVEVRLEDARAVIVRGEREGGVGEGGLRRVGFEIGEWVRGWEERERVGRRGS